MVSANALGSLFQGLAQGLQVGLQARAQRESLALRERIIGLQTAQGFASAISTLSDLDPAIAKVVGPNLLKPFVDPTSEEGKRILQGVGSMDEAGAARLKDIFTQEDLPILGGFLDTDEGRRAFRRNPLAFTLKAVEARKQRKKEERVEARSERDFRRELGGRRLLAEEDREFRREQTEAEMNFKRELEETDTQNKARLERLKASLDAGDPPEPDSMRKEFTRLSETFIDVRDSFDRIQASAEDPSAAGDLALVFNYMKILDPESTVREGEFATAQNAAGIPDRVRNIFNKILSGERLGTEQRKDFVDRAGRLFKKQEASQKKLVRSFTSLSRRAKLDPADVVIDFFSDEPTPDTVEAEEGLSIDKLESDLESRFGG